MKIAICGSMVFAEQMLETAGQLKKEGHEGIVPKFSKEYIGMNQQQREEHAVTNKQENDAILEHWHVINDCDAVLVLNFDKNDIKNYIGANTFLEMGFAYALGKEVFVLNELPDMPYLLSELEAMHPTILKGDLAQLKHHL